MASTESSNSADWRSSIEQSYRNSEVREIAKVLASLEPDATPTSKLRLAMQFEDAVFKAATSQEDYRKRLTKRLKKLQKSYVPTQPTASSETVKELQVLRSQYGEALRYIHKNSTKAVREMKTRHGNEKATQLNQHIDRIRHWMTELGMTENGKANVTMSADQLIRLKQELERRVENVRNHVIKLCEPDQFLRENLEHMETACIGKAAKIMGVDAQKRYEQLQKAKVDPNALMKESLQTIQKPIPLPTRSQRNDEKAALAHLDKMRAASTSLLAYAMMTDKTSIPRHTLSKSYTVAMEGIEFVSSVMKAHRSSRQESEVSLEDAWMKHLELPNADPNANNASSQSPPKRRRANNIVTRSKFLLTPRRKVPGNVLAALKMKRVRLVQPGNGSGAHLVLDFGKAFSMTIYMVPLVVTIRAYEELSGIVEENLQCAKWAPLQQGLESKGDISVWGTKGDYEALGKAVQERLRDASTHATYVLRQCFAAADKESAADFEREILEFNALNRFFTLVRTTYIPNWKDA